MPTLIAGKKIAGGGQGVDTHQTDQFIATAGQTDFLLSQQPVDNSDVRMKINGVAYIVGTDYTIGAAPWRVIWLDSLFVIEAGDGVEIEYDF